MWRWLLRLVPWSRVIGLLSGWQLWAVALSAALAAGFAGGWKVASWRVSAQEQARLEAALADAQAERDRTVAALADAEAERDRTVAALGDWYRSRLRIAEAKARAKEVIREKVVDRRECDIPGPVVRLLDAHRQGLPEATGGAAEGATESPTAGGLPQRAELQAHADLGDLYQTCRQQIIALRRWYRSD